MNKRLMIDKYIRKTVKSKRIPGCYLFVIDKGEVICHKGYGLADCHNGKEVNLNTYFQLGSNSKAFTALAILHLESQNKLKLSDNVSKYIPDFQVYYKKEKVEVTIENLLYHTSGISPKTIIDIEEDNENNALEKTVHILKGTETIFRPGEKFLYATINYDVLGYIIEVVAQTSFEDYITKEIFQDIGLNEEGIGFSCFVDEKIAKGYKREFLHNVQFNAPVYKGNVPSGYIYLNGEDMSKWVQFQLFPNEKWKKLIERSHEICQNALIKEETYYAAGWQVEEERGIVSHLGRNPNYVSCIYLKPKEKTGVAIMTNTSLTYAKDIGEQILCILESKKTSYIFWDYIEIIDVISSILMLLGMCCSFSLLYLTIKNIALNNFNIICLIKTGISFIGFSTLYYLIKKMVKHNKKIHLIKEFLKVWAPKSILGVISILFFIFETTFIYLINR